jgi:hypothetical protein
MKDKTTKKWKPKHRWIESITINLKGGKTKYKYFTPKTPEEERRLEAEFDENMKETIEAVLSSKNDTKENQK